MVTGTAAPLTAVLTVGSTRFDPLVAAALSSSTLAALSRLGVTRLLAQVGNSTLPADFSEGTHTISSGLILDVERFLDDLEDKVGNANIVVSHAGAGSILSFLRPESSSSTSYTLRRLVLVPNSTLMDSHQADLADELEKKSWALVCRDPKCCAALLASSWLERKLTVMALARSELVGVLDGLTTEIERGQGMLRGFPEVDTGKVQRILDETLGLP